MFHHSFTSFYLDFSPLFVTFWPSAWSGKAYDQLFGLRGCGFPGQWHVAALGWSLG